MYNYFFSIKLIVFYVLKTYVHLGMISYVSDVNYVTSICILLYVYSTLSYCIVVKKHISFVLIKTYKILVKSDLMSDMY